MKEIKSLFSKFELDEAKSDEIRAKLVSKRSAGRVWLIPVIAVAAAIAIIMVIPVTRTMVVNAAEKIFKSFHINTADGLEMGLETEPDTGKEYSYISYIRYDKTKSVEIARVKDGRLYLVLGEEWTDITDKCSATEYYRYELVHEDGAKEVILVGGVPEKYKYGWVIEIYDNEGNFMAVRNNIPYSSPRSYPNCEAEDFEWVKKAYEDEGMVFPGF